jgi:hypothetical protein
MADSRRTEIENTPNAEQMLALATALRPKNVSIAHAAIQGDSAELTLRSMDDAKMNGTLRMVKESGVWKVDKEDWKMKMN